MSSVRDATTSADEVRDLLVPDVPTVRYVELCELEAVIAETQSAPRRTAV